MTICLSKYVAYGMFTFLDYECVWLDCKLGKLWEVVLDVLFDSF